MALPSDILIGLDAGATQVEAVAFTADGHELARAAAPLRVQRVVGGGAEQDPGTTWQASAGVVRRLADTVPGLAQRTAALAITGHDGGMWLVDEDGDPVAAGWLAQDLRAAAVTEGWERAGLGATFRALTGRSLAPSAQVAQLACLRAERPEVLDRAACVLHAKDWLYACCTGERSTDPGEWAGSYGDVAAANPGTRVLDLLDLRELDHLLPGIVDGAHRHGALGPAAAAATGLPDGVPVVLGPASTAAATLAAGLDPGGTLLGGMILGPSIVLTRGLADAAATRAALDRADAVIRSPRAGSWLEVRRPTAGSATVDWLVGLAEELLVDAGLIGLARGDLRVMLERRAAEARPGTVRFAADGPRAQCHGLSGETTFYDLLRGVYEGIGLAIRASCATLDQAPAEVRIMGDGAASPLGRQVLAACVSAPLRPLRRTAPAATGAAMVAAVCLGHHPDVAAAFSSWVEPHLDDPEPVDPELRAVYDRLLATRPQPTMPAPSPVTGGAVGGVVGGA